MLIERTFDEIINHMKSSFKTMDHDLSKEFIKTIVKTENIFVLGGGRSGLVAKSFAMRLMHIGKKVCVIGENSFKINNKNDCILIAISGSGNTESIIEIAKLFKKHKIPIISINSNNKSPLAKLSDIFIIMKNYENKANEKESYFPMPLGTSFELATLLTLESMIPDLMKNLKVDEEYMRKRHVPFEFIDIYY